MDAVRQDPKRTGAGNQLHNEHANELTGDFKLPEVDMQEAASIKVSKVNGKNTMSLVTFVAGMGVRLSNPGRLNTADWRRP